MPKVNKNVGLETIFAGAINYIMALGQITKEESTAFYDNLVQTHKQYESKVFPYIYDLNNTTEAYLESKSL